MTVVADLVDGTRIRLLGNTLTELNQLGGDTTISDTTVSLGRDIVGLTGGATIGIGLETMYVWDVGSGFVEVERGYLNSPITPHSEGDLIEINSPFPRSVIFSELNNAIRRMTTAAQGLYTVRYLDVTRDGRDAIDLTGVENFIDIQEIRYREGSSRDQWPRVKSWSLQRDANIDIHASQLALTILDITPHREMRVYYKSGFSDLPVSLSGCVEDYTGLSDSMSDIPPMSATLSLMASREISRNRTDTQGDTRRANEVPMTALSQSMRELQRLLTQRLSEERAELGRRWAMYLK